MKETNQTDAMEITEEETPVMESAEEATAEDMTVEETEKVEELDADDVPDDETEEPKAEKEIDLDQMMAYKASRFSHEVAKASKKAKKEMYRSEHVFTEFGDEDIETDSTILKEDYLELVASSKSQKILEGVITGFHYVNKDKIRKSTLCADVEFGHGLFNVVIPSYLLYDYEMSNYVEPDKMQVIENNIKRRIGAKIKFIARHVDEKEQIAYADRLLAMSIIGHENYIKERRDGVPRLVNGVIVKSQVISTVSRGVIVDALGCDIAIPKDEISHSYVGDAREELHVGDYVNVRVSDIGEKTVNKNNANYRLVTAKGSIKDATPNRRKKLFDMIQEGSECAAEITYIEDSGVYCRLRGGMDCLCALPRFGQNPRRGQKRVVRITEKDADRLFVYGVFVNN